VAARVPALSDSTLLQPSAPRRACQGRTAMPRHNMPEKWEPPVPAECANFAAQ